MAIQRKRHSAETKRQVALEALKQQKTMNEITSEYGVHSSQISSWKKQALTAIEGIFSGGGQPVLSDRQSEIDELHRQLGLLTAERDWLKKSSGTAASDEEAIVVFLTSTLSHLKALILFAINLKLHTTAFAFLKALLLFLLGFYHSSGTIRFCSDSAQTQHLYAAPWCAPASPPQRYKLLVARA